MGAPNFQDPVVGRRRTDVAAGWRLVDLAVWTWYHWPRPGLRLSKGYLLVLPGIAIVAILGAGLGLVGWYSLHSYDPFLAQQGGWSLTHYREILGDSYYLKVAIRTITLSLLATLISLALAMPIAYLLVRTSSQIVRVVLLVVVLVPFLTGEVVLTYGWLIILGPQGGLAWLLGEAGISDFSLIGSQAGVVVGITQIMTPLCTIMLTPALRVIDPDVERAASTLGARPWRVWLHVILPLARMGLASAAAIGFAVGMTAFAIPGLIGNGFQDFSSNLIYQTYFAQGNIYLGSAVAILVLFIASFGVGSIVWAGTKGNGQPDGGGRK